VFVHGLRKIHQLRDPRCFAGWLRRITVRMAINVQSRERIAINSSDMSGDTMFEKEMPGKEEESAILSLRNERSMAVRRALEGLKESDRDTLIMFYYRGLSLKQMAKIAEAPTGTIKRRLYVARQRLQEILEGEECLPEYKEAA
jgi:RNA polymerase sigma-70 factor, ECF subfamily